MKEWIWRVGNNDCLYDMSEFIMSFILELEMMHGRAYGNTWSYNGFLTEC